MGLTGQGMADFSKSLLGTPYFYGSKLKDGNLTEAKMATMHRLYPSVVTNSYMAKARVKNQVGRVNVDCSGVIGGYRNKDLGSSQLYATAYTRLPIANIKDFAVGTTLWKPGHVATYIGTVNGIPMCVEAKGIDYGTITSRVGATPFKYGLTFKDIDYTFDKNLSETATYKGKNPYKEPVDIVKKGSIGEDTKWVQWELAEAGFGHQFAYNGIVYGGVKIDGDCGKITGAAIRSYQQSCKIVVDGKVGETTRKYLKAN